MKDDKEGVYKEALQKIFDRFEDRQGLHKDDCFAYQVAKYALFNSK